MEKYSDNFIGNYLISHAIHQPDGLLAVYGDRKVTWGQMNDRVNRLSRRFLQMGVKKGDKISFMFHNCPEFMEVNWAVQKVGAVPVPINYRFTPREVEHQCINSDSVLLLLEDIWAPVVQEARPQLSGVREFICSGPGCPGDMINYGKALNGSEPLEPDVPTGPDDICVMIYTGGTTGFPKGVMLSYQSHLDMFVGYLSGVFLNIALLDLAPDQIQKISSLSNSPGIASLAVRLLQTSSMKKILAKPFTERFVKKRIEKLLSDPERVLNRIGDTRYNWMIPSLPFFHAASYQLLFLFVISGINVFYLTEGFHFNPDAIFKLVQKVKPVIMANVPAGWKKLMDSADSGTYDMSSILAAVTGAGVCTLLLKRKIMEKLPGAIVLDIYGQTEMTPITSMRIDASPVTLKERSVGRSFIETRIIDENGNDVPQGVTGEIIYRGSTVMKGYYKDEEKTKNAFIDGWFKSGDLGYFDEDGEIRIAERKNECISTGGEKVFPGEVEEIIQKHPSVDMVCVIGIPDETWGNSIRAVVSLAEGRNADENEIIDFCKDKMAGYKRPRSVVFVKEFPMSPAGKVLRAKIKEVYGK